MTTVVPEIIRSFETSAHDSFLRALHVCGKAAGNLESPEFTLCIKASAVNFGYAYNAFNDYRTNVNTMSKKGQLEWTWSIQSTALSIQYIYTVFSLIWVYSK